MFSVRRGAKKGERREIAGSRGSQQIGSRIIRARLLFVSALLLFFPRAVEGKGMEGIFPEGKDLAPLVREGPVEIYGPDSLWEKINGEAELFRRFDVQEAAFARYSRPGDPDESLEIGIFLLSGDLPAFGLFSFFSPPDNPVEPLGNGGSVSDYQGFLWQGPRFVMVNAFGPAGTTASTVRRSLVAVGRRLGPPGEAPAPLAAVEKILKGGGIRYRPDHLLGRRVMPPGLEGRDGKGTLFFLATVPVQSAPLLSSYGDVMTDTRSETSGPTRFLWGRDPALGPVIIAVKGDRLAGVRAASLDEDQRQLLLQLLEVSLLHPGSY
jgi:hypothetical protein